MRAEFAHEQAQTYLRQRNRFAVLAGVLGLTTLVSLGAAVTRDEQVVLVPITAERITVSSGGIDAPWAMLKGGSMGEFVETYARTARKYGGALATATQSLNDYYKSDGARAALENSDWMLVLQQKAETIADFRANARLDMDDRTETLIRSLKRSGTEYSEVFIKGPETEAVGRLVLDPFSATIYSSDPDTYAAIQDCERRGHSLADAIRIVAGGGQ